MIYAIISVQILIWTANERFTHCWAKLPHYYLNQTIRNEQSVNLDLTALDQSDQCLNSEPFHHLGYTLVLFLFVMF